MTKKVDILDLPDILGVLRYCDNDDCLNNLVEFGCAHSDIFCNEHCGHEH